MNQLKENELILITIKRLGINGEGIGFYKRLAVFVPGALPGEQVEVKITAVSNKFVSGEITKFKEKSPDRVEPVCKYFGKCGGCQLQHLSYKAQLVEKRNLVEEAFHRYYEGNTDKIKFLDTIGMENPLGYRNKSSLPVRPDGDKLVCGIYAISSNRLVYIDECPIENELINKTRDIILKKLTEWHVDVYNPRLKRGILRYLVIRCFPNSDEVQVTFILTKEDDKAIKVLKDLDVKSANYSINSDPESYEIFSGEVINVKGSKTISGKLGDLNFEISPNAFFQLNTKQTENLYKEIKKAAKLTGTENVLDCYCGIGSIGMYLAPDSKEVRGIDLNKEGIVNAINFAKMNNVNNATFYSGNILPNLREFKAKGFVPDVLVVDPPRRGIELNVINYIQSSNIRRVVYVSCNPATLAKNINHLHRDYIVRYVQPIDMFPETSNVECVVCLERR